MAYFPPDDDPSKPRHQLGDKPAATTAAPEPAPDDDTPPEAPDPRPRWWMTVKLAEPVEAPGGVLYPYLTFHAPTVRHPSLTDLQDLRKKLEDEDRITHSRIYERPEDSSPEPHDSVARVLEERPHRIRRPRQPPLNG